MFLTRTVPVAVPSEVHSSFPWVPSSALKNSLPPTSVRFEGPYPSPPRRSGSMSLTRTVPAFVPSEVHSSLPWTPSSAVKNNFPPPSGGQFGPWGPYSSSGALRGLMSLTRTVPAFVPSEVHSSFPWTPSSAVKNNRPPTSVRFEGLLWRPRGSMSLTRTVPAFVPSEVHSSLPWTPSSAVKNNLPPTAVRDSGPYSSYWAPAVLMSL